MKVALIIFTRNERENSERMYPKIPFSFFNATYVIDGNSSDGTQDFWKNKKIAVFNQKYKGVGGAYESAFRNTKEDALVFFHPDGNMEPKDLKKFMKLLNENKQFIVATRMVKGARNEEDDHLLKPRKWFCQIMGVAANIMWGKHGNKTTDITQGYRAITRTAYKKMAIRIPNFYAPDFEHVIKALKNNIPIYEFTTKEYNRMSGDTTMPALRTGWAHIKLFVSML